MLAAKKDSSSERTGLWPSLARLKKEANGQYLHRIPRPRSGHRVFTDDEYLYIIGGYSKNGPRNNAVIFRELHAFNLLTQEWRRYKTLGDVPSHLASFSIVQTSFNNRQFLLFGGSGVSFGQSSSNVVYLLTVNPDTETVESERLTTSGDRKEPCYGHAMVNGEDEFTFYVVGGTDGFIFNVNVHKLQVNPKTMEWTWTKLNKEYIEGRYKFELAFENGLLYIIGGGNSENTMSLEKILCFDVAEQTYKIIETRDDVEYGFPTERRCFSLSRFGDEVFVAGGCQDLARQIFVLDDIWALNLKTNRWRFVTDSMPIPVFFHDSAITSDGCLLIHGGVTTESSQKRTAFIQHFLLSCPSLKTLTAEAVYARLRDDLKKQTSENPTSREFRLKRHVDLVRAVNGESTLELKEFWLPRSDQFVIMKHDTQMLLREFQPISGDQSRFVHSDGVSVSHLQRVDSVAMDKLFCQGQPRQCAKVNEVYLGQVVENSIFRALHSNFDNCEGVTRATPHVIYVAENDDSEWNHSNPLGEDLPKDYENIVKAQVIANKC